MIVFIRHYSKQLPSPPTMKSLNSMSLPSRIYQSLRSPDTSQPFQRLVPFNWGGELLVICSGMLLSFLVAGFWWPYWRIADMDFWTVYNAFLLNDNLPQEFFIHPGYLTILTLSYWLRALHEFGIVHVISLLAIPPLSDPSGFALAWTHATQAGRVLSLLYAMGFVTAFAYLLRALLHDWRIAALGAFLLAFSGGMAMEMRIMRTELLAVAFSTWKCVAGDASYRSDARPADGSGRRSSAWPGLLLTLAMQNKIQLMFLICAVPVLLLPFGAERTRQTGFWNTPHLAWPALAAIVAVALLGIFLAKDILITGFSTTSTAALALPALRFGASFYWPAVAIWVGLRHGRLRLGLARRSHGNAGCYVCRIGRLHVRAAGVLYPLQSGTTASWWSFTRSNRRSTGRPLRYRGSARGNRFSVWRD